ncbi:MAG: DUF4982 domain-containing protein [Kiritimatiellae bacterium]|nr:DUF4982 domain-containing protein [Kiritimatiellia bacterium]
MKNISSILPFITVSAALALFADTENLADKTSPHAVADSIKVETSLDGTISITGEVADQNDQRWIEKKTVKIENPVWWTPETPRLYATDFFGESVKFGIRTVAWNATDGFLLNGKSILLHGACVTAGNEPLDKAAGSGVELRKVRLLKKAGFNAVRVNCAAASEAFLDACDAEGLLVMDDVSTARHGKPHPSAVVCGLDTGDIAECAYTANAADEIHSASPGRLVVYTGTASKDAVEVWKRAEELPYVIGEFVKTGIDHPGEPYGDIDFAGHRKPISHLRETLWNANAPTYVCAREPDGRKDQADTAKCGTLPTLEHWNFDDWEGTNITVYVYTRRPKVNLYINGEIVDTQNVSAATAYTASFEVPYEKGEIKAVAFGDGQYETAYLRTAGTPAHIIFAHEVFGGLEYVTAEIVDDEGIVCPYANVNISFGGDPLATCSGDLDDAVPATSNVRKAFGGRALAIYPHNEK